MKQVLLPAYQLRKEGDREKIKEALAYEVSGKDVNYHLSRNNNGLAFEGVITERKGVIAINKRSFESLSRAIGYLIKLRQYQKAFDTAFAECFYSGYGESLHHLSVIRDMKEEGLFADPIAVTLPFLLSEHGVRVPWGLADEKSDSIIGASIEIFRRARGVMNTKIQLSFIANVLGISEFQRDPESVTLLESSTFLIGTDTMLRQARHKIDVTMGAFSRVVSMANGERDTFLGPVSENEKVMMQMSLMVVNVYGWNARIGHATIANLQEILPSLQTKSDHGDLGAVMSGIADLANVIKKEKK